MYYPSNSQFSLFIPYNHLIFQTNQGNYNVKNQQISIQTQTISNVKYNEAEDNLNQFLLSLKNLDRKEDSLSFWKSIFPSCRIDKILDETRFLQIFKNSASKFKQSSKKKFTWSSEDLNILLWIIYKYCLYYNLTPLNFTELDWKFIGKMIPNRTYQDCMYKFLVLHKNSIQLNPWKQEEEIYLFALAQQQKLQKKDWVYISRALYQRFPGCFRHPKQCRQHWTLHIINLHNKAKTPWTLEEDIVLLQNYEKMGRKWKKISLILQGRSQNAIKNRFVLICEKYKIKKRNPSYQNIKFLIKNLTQYHITLEEKKLEENNPMIKIQ